MKKLCLIVSLIVLTAVPASAQWADSLSAGFHRALQIYQNADPLHKDAVAQMIIGGLDLNENGLKEFLYITDGTYTGGRDLTQTDASSLFLYEYNPASSSSPYKLIWSYNLPGISNASFPVFTITDLDGDGHKEIAVAVQYGAGEPAGNLDPYRLQVFEFGPNQVPLGMSGGATLFAPSGSNTRPSGIASGDVDGDGKEELGIGFRAWNGTARGVMIVSLDGDLEWTSLKVEAIDTTTVISNVYGTVRVTDLDNDGKKEFCFGYDNGTMVLYEATGPDKYQRYTWNTNPAGVTGGPIFSMQQVDINKDGKNELIYGQSGTVSLNVIAGVTDLAKFDISNVYRIGAIPQHPSSTINEVRGMTAGDFDGNGKTDIFACNGWRVWRYEYKGTGAITDSASYNVSWVYQDTTSGTRFRWVTFPGDVWSRSLGVTVNDMNGNKKPELLLANQRGGSPDSTAVKVAIIEYDAVVNGVSADMARPKAADFRLEQNYPNPFNPSTTIAFNIPQASHVHLDVYDMLGRLVDVVVDAPLEAGWHNATWNASQFGSGMYVCRMTLGAGMLSQKMLLVR